jgi:hypothetical protein
VSECTPIASAIAAELATAHALSISATELRACRSRLAGAASASALARAVAVYRSIAGHEPYAPALRSAIVAALQSPNLATTPA